MPPLHTERLIIEEITLAAAPFVVELLNDGDFIRHIADRGVRTVADAERFLTEGPLHSYREHGFGMYLVRERSSGAAVGMCGLVKREALPDIDIGYAFLPRARGRGLALEAAQAVMRYAVEELRLTRLLAIVAPDNQPSRRLLERLGLRYQRPIRLSPEENEICLYRWSSN